MKRTPANNRTIAISKGQAFTKACKALGVAYLEPTAFRWSEYPGVNNPDWQTDVTLDKAIEAGAKLVFDFQTRNLRNKVPAHQTAIYREGFVEIGACLAFDIKDVGPHWMPIFQVVCRPESYGLGKVPQAIYRIKELADLQPTIERRISLEKLEGYIEGLLKMRNQYNSDYLLFQKRMKKWDFLEDPKEQK